MEDSSKPHEVALSCGWGRLLFSSTFDDPKRLAEELLSERRGQRDIALYVNSPHLVVGRFPQDLFLDPSHTLRLSFTDYSSSDRGLLGIRICELQSKDDIEEINRIYTSHNMVPVDKDFVWENRDHPAFTYFLARDKKTNQIQGVGMGGDHVAAFGCDEGGSSIWALAVDAQAKYPGIGESLTRYIIEFYKSRGRRFLDLSVMHNNESALKLYNKLGFKKIRAFAVKRRNTINETLYLGDPPDKGYNPYASIIIKEAMRRGIMVEPLDPNRGYFRLNLGGRSITCLESLSELTSAIAFTRCDDKQVTRELFKLAKLSVPEQAIASDSEENAKFLEKHGSLVVKPARGEQGSGVAVDLRTEEEVEDAVAEAVKVCDTVLLEQYVQGQDLRIIVINNEVVAAAVRKPASVVGTGRHSVQELIESLSRRRSAATAGESRIPLDGETLRCVRNAGYEMDSILAKEESLTVRKTANLHTGGTIHDVTDMLHEDLEQAALEGASALGIPVVGLDMMVPKVDGPEYYFIEANERPGLANHEPQPTAEKFIDLLFPQTARHETQEMIRPGVPRGATR